MGNVAFWLHFRMQPRQTEAFVTGLDELRDLRARARVQARIDRLAGGNAGDARTDRIAGGW